MNFGRQIENALSERDKDGKPVHKLADLLADPAREGERVPDDASQFRSMASMITKRVRVNEDGTW